MRDDRRIEDVPPAWGASVRLSASIEPEAAAMLEALAKRLYPGRRAGQARALVLETGIRALYRQVIAYATRIATAQLNRHATPWIWGCPPPPQRHRRRCFVYRL